MSKKHYVYPVASCKGCHLWLTKDNLMSITLDGLDICKGETK